jgi:pyruvate dehydrogenase complex dehydrogenase (E1) component
MTQVLLAVLLRKQKIHEAFVKRKEEGQRVCTRLAIALKETRLTGGALFKVRQIVLEYEVLVLRKERDAAIRNGKRQGIIKFVDKYNKCLEQYRAVIATTKQEQEYTVPELKAWLTVHKTKEEGVMPTTLAALKAMHEKLKDKEPLTLPEYLADEGHSPSLIATILETGHKEETGEEEESVAEGEENTIPIPV